MKKASLFFQSLSVAVLILYTMGWAPAADKVLSSTDSVRISLSRGRSVTDIKNGSIGEKMAEFEPTVDIVNSSFNSFRANRACVIMMGEDTTMTDTWKVMYRREFDVDLEAGKPFKWVGDPFKEGFDRTLAKSGYDYDGYIVILRNAEGKAVIGAATKSFWIKDLDRAWNLKEGAITDKGFFKKS